MRSKNSQVQKNYKKIKHRNIIGIWISQSHAEGSATLASGEISHAEGVIKADTSHVTQSLIYLPQVIRTH
jgi:hypothetical protein